MMKDTRITLIDGRRQIDALDAQILGLLSRRLELVKAMARAKALDGLPMHDPARESALLADREASPAASNLPQGMARAVFALIVEYCRRAGEAIR